jgi:hypothetical protein
LGAKVGLVRNSGRVAGILERETEQERPAGLAVLPDDVWTLQAFLRWAAPSLLTPEQEEHIARASHEQYRRENEKRLAPSDPAMQPWEELSPGLQHSNVRQAKDLGRKLAAIGRRVVPVAGREIKPAMFTLEEVELLAKMEHGRWNVERALDGWRQGARDPKKKLTPFLARWEELDGIDPNAQEWDRNIVRAIPEHLANVGLEIQQTNAED